MDATKSSLNSLTVARLSSNTIILFNFIYNASLMETHMAENSGENVLLMKK